MAVTYLNREYVEIDGGIIAESTDPELVGTKRVFVVYVDEEGGRLGVWDGVEHADALAAARDWELPIVDRTRPAQ